MEQGIRKKPCTRCLLREAGETDLAELIAERISVIPEEQRADEKLYSERLGICGSCGSLNAGTCTKCGCYAELRAARINSHCPDETHKW